MSAPINNYIFKYKEYLEKLPCECPDLNIFKPVNRLSYRFSHSDVAHQNNHIPPVLIRKAPPGASCKVVCSNYALSFFSTVQQAEQRFLAILAKVPMFKNSVGDYISACQIAESDGVACAPGNDGHFELHEFAQTNFVGRYVIVKQINT
jgi:hypothetical protein